MLEPYWVLPKQNREIVFSRNYDQRFHGGRTGYVVYEASPGMLYNHLSCIDWKTLLESYLESCSNCDKPHGRKMHPRSFLSRKHPTLRHFLPEPVIALIENRTDWFKIFDRSKSGRFRASEDKSINNSLSSIKRLTEVIEGLSQIEIPQSREELVRVFELTLANHARNTSIRDEIISKSLSGQRAIHALIQAVYGLAVGNQHVFTLDWDETKRALNLPDHAKPSNVESILLDAMANSLFYDSAGTTILPALRKTLAAAGILSKSKQLPASQASRIKCYENALLTAERAMASSAHTSNYAAGRTEQDRSPYEWIAHLHANANGEGGDLDYIIAAALANLSSGDGGRLISCNDIASLIAASAYGALACGVPLKKCANCGRTFFQHGKSKYCFHVDMNTGEACRKNRIIRIRTEKPSEGKPSLKKELDSFRHKKAKKGSWGEKYLNELPEIVKKFEEAYRADPDVTPEAYEEWHKAIFGISIRQFKPSSSNHICESNAPYPHIINGEVRYNKDGFMYLLEKSQGLCSIEALIELTHVEPPSAEDDRESQEGSSIVDMADDAERNTCNPTPSQQEVSR